MTCVSMDTFLRQLKTDLLDQKQRLSIEESHKTTVGFDKVA